MGEERPGSKSFSLHPICDHRFCQLYLPPNLVFIEKHFGDLTVQILDVKAIRKSVA